LDDPPRVLGVVADEAVEDVFFGVASDRLVVFLMMLLPPSGLESKEFQS
jgi:hypothetical protein